MEGDQKLQVKLGEFEFSAEGPDASVKEAFDRFLEAVKAAPATKPPQEKSLDDKKKLSGGEAVGLTNPAMPLDRLFLVEGEIVTLKLLPQGTENKVADAAILLLYGFLKLLNKPEVQVTKLNVALRKSGLTFGRTDTVLSVYSNLFMKGGRKSGGKYTLNNQGINWAEKCIAEKFT